MCVTRRPPNEPAHTPPSLRLLGRCVHDHSACTETRDGGNRVRTPYKSIHVCIGPCLCTDQSAEPAVLPVSCRTGWRHEGVGPGRRIGVWNAVIARSGQRNVRRSPPLSLPPSVGSCGTCLSRGRRAKDPHRHEKETNNGKTSAGTGAYSLAGVGRRAGTEESEPQLAVSTSCLQRILNHCVPSSPHHAVCWQLSS